MERACHIIGGGPEIIEVPDAPVEKPKVVDLMAALEASVAKAKEARGDGGAERRASGSRKQRSA